MKWAVLRYDRSLYQLFDNLLTERNTRRKQKTKFPEQVKQIILTAIEGQVLPIEVLAALHWTWATPRKPKN